MLRLGTTRLPRRLEMLPEMAETARLPGQRRRNIALAGIKAFHSAVFLLMLGAILWLVATGIAGRRDRSVAVAAALVSTESAVFIANRGVCPLTPLAERYGAAPGRGGVSDIYLPNALARTIPIWATGLLTLGVALHVRGLRSNRARARLR